MALSVEEQVRWWSIGFAVFIAFAWVMADVLLPFLAGAALAYFLDPIADRLETRGLSRLAATALVTLLMIGLFLAALLILIPAAVNQAQSLVETLPDYAARLDAYVRERFPDALEEGAPLAEAVSTLQARAKEWSVSALQNAWTGGLAVIDFLTLIIVTPVVAFYMLLDWDRLIARIDAYVPRDHVRTVRRIAGDVDSVLAGFVRGQLTVCVILGTFYAVALMAIGLDFGLAIGFFAGLISFIPFIGSITGGLISVGVALAQFWGEPFMILGVAGIFLVGQAVEGNVLTPKLVGGSVGLHPVTLMFALAAFGYLLGFTGLLIAVPTAAAIGVLFRFAMRKYMEGRLYRGLAATLEDEAQAEYLAAEAFPPDPPEPEPKDRRDAG